MKINKDSCTLPFRYKGNPGFDEIPKEHKIFYQTEPDKNEIK